MSLGGSLPVHPPFLLLWHGILFHTVELFISVCRATSPTMQRLYLNCLFPQQWRGQEEEGWEGRLRLDDCAGHQQVRKGLLSWGTLNVTVPIFHPKDTEKITYNPQSPAPKPLVAPAKGPSSTLWFQDHTITTYIVQEDFWPPDFPNSDRNLKWRSDYKILHNPLATVILCLQKSIFKTSKPHTQPKGAR